MSHLHLHSDSITIGIRWVARALSLLVAGVIVLFFIGDGGLNPLKLTAREFVLMLFFFTTWLGLLLAWRWELVGGAMTVGGISLFYLFHLTATGHLPRGWAFGIIALPGLFFLLCWLRDTIKAHRAPT